MVRINSKPHSRIEMQEIPFEGVGEDELLSSLDEVASWIINDSLSIELKELSEEVLHRCRLFCRTFYRTKSKLGKIHLESYYDACKNRSDDLNDLIVKLSLIDNEVELVVLYGENASDTQSLRYISGKSSIYIIDLDNEISEVYTIHRHPKFYSPLFVGVIKVMEKAILLQHINRTEYKFCLYLCEVMLSLSRIYLEFRSNQTLIIKQEQGMFEQLQTNHQLDKTSECYNYLQEVIKDIGIGKLPYIKEFSQALESCKEFTQSTYNDKDYYFSARATSSRVRNSRRQVSLIASAYEIDPYCGLPIDEKIGYISHYNKIPPEGFDDPQIRTITINQHKLKRRGIHIGNNPIQDRCSYIHRRAINILNHLPSDCTKRQESGWSFAKRVTSPKYREDHNYPSVLCMDFSNATDTLNQEFQSLCLRSIFDSQVIDFWDMIMSSPKSFEFKFMGSKSYLQSTGQPQGVLGSFDSFALAHHFVMLMTMKMSNLVRIKASEFYRVLGDDSIISSVLGDPDDIVLKNYNRICDWANLKINLGKSHLVYHKDRMAFAEFAKVSVLNGEVLTPPPIRILSRISAGKTNYYSYATAIWMLEHGYEMPNLLSNLNQKWFGYSEISLEIANNLIFGGLIPQFHKYQQPILSDIVITGKIALCYLITKIRGTFLECFMNDKDREDLSMSGYTISDGLTEIINDLNLDWFDSIIDPEHKLLKAISKNLLLEDSLKSILGVSNAKVLLPLLIDLTNDEITAIFSIADYIELAKASLIDETTVPGILDTIKKIETLDRFQMRSLHKHAVREISYFDEVISMYNILFTEDSTENVIPEDQLDIPLTITQASLLPDK